MSNREGKKMCNLILLYKVMDNFPVIVLHSRYEETDRVEYPPRIINYPYKVYAPLDIPSRGSWIGINGKNVFASVTNQYSTVKRPGKRGRGLLVLEILGNASNARKGINYVKGELDEKYKPANFVIADPHKAFHIIYEEEIHVRELEAGKHVITPLTPLEGKEMSEKLNKIRERAKKRKKRSLKLLNERTKAESQKIDEIITKLRRIAQDHNESPNRNSICYHTPENKFEQTSASIITMHKTNVKKSKILYCQGNPCEHNFINYSHILTKEKDVTGGEIQQKTEKLAGKKIALCLTGSVASIISPKLSRELRRHGAKVKCYMTKAAKENGVSPNVMEWATGQPPVTKLSGKVEHLEDFSSVIIYPATYNTIGKIASGVADNPVTTLCGSVTKDKLIIAPAMSLDLWENPPLRKNIKRLQDLGATFVNPHFKEGIAKVAGIQEITNNLIRNVRNSRLKKRQVLILTGPTRANIDPVRYISNKSSGQLGRYLTQESIQHGCSTTLIYGPGQAKMPKGGKVLHVYSPDEMLNTTLKELEEHQYEIVIFSAAVLDFKPKKKFNKKLRSGQTLNLELEPTKKIVNKVNSKFPSLFTVGFKLEYNIQKKDLKKKGFTALKNQEADLLVANDLATLQGVYHPAYLIGKNGVIRRIQGSKRELAARIFNEIEQRI